MFHSIPALAISGLGVFLLYDHDNLGLHSLPGAGVMIGFLSHLVLDEIYAVDLGGLVPRLNQFAGSARKLSGRRGRQTPSPRRDPVPVGCGGVEGG